MPRERTRRTTIRIGRARRSRLRALTLVESTSDSCSKALLILTHAHDSADAFLKAYDLARSQRGGRGRRAPRGMSTDEEQDLLRGMLVMAAAGLDSMVKQLVREALPRVVHDDRQAKSGLERHILSRARPPDSDFLSKVLASPTPTHAVVQDYVGHLTASSLQSASELARAASAFGLEPRDVGIDFEELRGIFEIRNRIIHELDIDFEARRRVRRVRRADTMVRHTNALLGIGEKILRAIDGKVDRLAKGL